MEDNVQVIMAQLGGKVQIIMAEMGVIVQRNHRQDVGNHGIDGRQGADNPGTNERQEAR